jgi:Alternative complex III, ActD subunit
MTEALPLYGVIGRFDEPDKLLAAVRQLRRDGYRELEACTPFPVAGLAEELHAGHDRLALWALIGGLFGAVGSYLLQYYAAVVAYPLNIGGRPLHSWPAFIPLSIEFTLLGAALALVLGLMFGSRLPDLHHPLFAVPGFEAVSQDAFFLCLRGSEKEFDRAAAAARLADAGASDIREVIL